MYGEKYIFLCLLYCYIKIKNVLMCDTWNGSFYLVSHGIVYELKLLRWLVELVFTPDTAYSSEKNWFLVELLLKDFSL